MSLLTFSILNFVCGIVAHALTAWGAYRDTKKVGTALLPVYKWCSAKHFIQGLPLAFHFGLSWVGILLGADPNFPAFPSGILYVLLGGVAVFTVTVYVVTEVLWNQAEKKWSPLIVAATSNCYCTYCGGRVIENTYLGGYCPVCGAAPDKPCDPHRHQRHETTGDPLPQKGRGVGQRHLQGSRRH